ncbi:beta-ketoacyl synthase N-terminal-like domain-containing protein [Streptomyces sp. NPDC004232]|uniref:beta-ketoacyl synthase N-terminal-like domain-containing protein n=1 Tax=Streptomyces sp. NPDC004232 TaxID=3154454 RepID=UPI0033ABE841
MRRPCAVTGIGVVAPNGMGHEAYWAQLLNGKTGIVPIPDGVAGVVTDFDAARFMPAELVVRTDRWTQFGIAATALALRDAGIDLQAIPEYDIGVVTGSSSGGNEFGQREIGKLWTKGPSHVSAYQSIAWFYAATTGQVSIRFGARGPCSVVVTEQASGLDALAHTERVLRQGARVVLTGGTEAPLSPYALACQRADGRISAATDPERAFRPFDRQADGNVPGEGGAMFVVEDRPAAGRRAYGYLAGHAATFDPRPGGGEPGLRRAIELAIGRAGLTPADIDAVFADGCAVPELDQQEAEAIEAVFGPYGVPVTVPKTMVGRLYAGGGALDLATALLALRNSMIPPTTGAPNVPEHYRIDLVLDLPRPTGLRAVLVLARGRGGHNSAVVLTSEPP